tara:strand:+ start:408 stop:965 length:558 start_codon:yes stop_codon:yes gene_type:complete
MNKFKIIFLICIFSYNYPAHGLSWGKQVYNQENMQCAIVDSTLVSKNSLAMIDARRQLEEIMVSYNSQSRNIQQMLQEKLKIIEQQKELVDVKEYRRIKEEFEKEVHHKQKALYVQQQSFEELQIKVEEIFSIEIRKIISAISMEKNFGIVLDKSSTFYSSEMLDISGIILEKLNKHLKKIDVRK